MIKSLISNWSNYPKVLASKKSFSYDQQAKEIIRSNGEYIARGGGKCYGDSSLQNTVVSTLKYNKILLFDSDKKVISCQSGIGFDSLLEFLMPKGLFLPVTPGTKYITLGGAIASDIHGKNHHIDGSFCNHVIDMHVLLPSGVVLFCNREIEPDLFKSTCGGMGLTGTILSATFTLKKIESTTIDQISIKAKNLEEIFDLFEKNKNSTYSVAWIDCLQKGEHMGRSLLLLGEHTRNKNGSKQKSIKIRSNRPIISLPFYFPNWILNKYSVGLFNYLFYHKQLRKQKRKTVDYNQFFYPLDFIKNWNKMYGTRGFVQYQFVLPMETSMIGLKQILQEIQEYGKGSFLAVLKLFGNKPGEGFISFPQKGYTLALDFPIDQGLFKFLDKLDELVLKHGGHIYLTKDARMKKETYWASYKEATQFQNSVKRFNPNFLCRSLQSDRLGITQ
jgi:decaprenylphospho-beta-D-ribofuranose 2-oxidase